jgi:tRNA dimethylallyltransferase
MSTASVPQAIVLTGPTGAGKSALAVEVAERIGGAILSADSRQVYRGMDIGTAKPAAELRRRVPHFGLDLLSPVDSYSAGRFARDAWRWIAEIRAGDRVPLIVGGTGLFIRALLEPLAPEPDLEPRRRDGLRGYLTALSVDELKRWLRRLDPRRAGQLRGEGGRQRLSRSLEVALLSGRPHSAWLEAAPEARPLDAVVCCLELPRAELYRRIETRFDRMMDLGFLEETRRLCERYSASAPGLDSLGYSELARHIDGQFTLGQAVEEAKRQTRRFAKRQLTWFRHQLPPDSLWLDGTRPQHELADRVVAAWEERTTLETP